MKEVNWQTVKLGEIAVQDRVIITPDSTEAKVRPFLGLDQIEANTGRILSYDSISSEGKCAAFAFDTSHVLYSKLRPYLNKVAIPEQGGRCSTEIIPLKPNGVDRDFLGFLLRRNEIVVAAMSEKTGSRMPRADIGALLNYDVKIPESMDEQRHIVARLKAQLAEVEKARQAAENQSKELNFVLNQIIEERIIGVIAKGEKLIRLGEVVSITAKIVNPTLTEYSDLPHVSAENIESMTGRLVNVRSAKEDGMTSGKYLFDEGDVLYSKLRPYLRKVTKSCFKGLCSADMYPIKIRENCLDVDFLKLLLISNLFTDYANEKSARSRMPKLNREQLFEFGFNLPSIERQQKCVKKVNDAVKYITRATESVKAILADINALPRKILAQAFGG